MNVMQSACQISGAVAFSWLGPVGASGGAAAGNRVYGHIANVGELAVAHAYLAGVGLMALTQGRSPINAIRAALPRSEVDI